MALIAAAPDRAYFHTTSNRDGFDGDFPVSLTIPAREGQRVHSATGTSPMQCRIILAWARRSRWASANY